MKKTVRSTWNFGRKQTTPAQGSAGEAHMNMDVDLRRLSELIKIFFKILSAPYSFFRFSICPMADLHCHLFHIVEKRMTNF